MFGMLDDEECTLGYNKKERVTTKMTRNILFPFTLFSKSNIFQHCFLVEKLVFTIQGDWYREKNNTFAYSFQGRIFVTF